MDTENYYKPWCKRCNKYVHPQVVSSTHLHRGVTHEKMCPECGEQVFSQEDVDAYKAQQKAAKEGAKLSLILILVIAGVPIGAIILLVVLFWVYLFHAGGYF